MAYQKHNFKDGDILKAEHLNCIEDCIAEEPNWNAAEGEPGHVLNRTHWVEKSTVEVMPETTITFYAGNNRDFEEPLGIMPGKTYIVNFDGVEYKCKAFSIALGGPYKVTIIGDFSHAAIGAPATGDPFGIMEMDAETAAAMNGTSKYLLFIKQHVTDVQQDFTFSITEVNETAHKLDGMYLPNGVPYLEVGGEPVELLPPTKLEEENGAFIVPADAGIVLVDGGKYVVNWNGTEYTCTAQYFEMNGESGIVMGNIGLALGDGEDTGEPFVILHSEMLAAMGASLNVISLAGDTEVTLGLTGSPPEIIHKLDPKLLPDGVPYAVDGETVVLPETQLQFVGGNKYQSCIYTPFSVTIGETYIVNLNGKKYKCNCMDASVYDEQYAGIPGLLPEGVDLSTGAGLEFGVLCFPEALEGVVYGIVSFVNEQESGTISIWGGGKEIRKLDNDCLDLAWLPTMEEVQIAAEKTVTNDMKNGFPELNKNMVYDGMPLVIYWDGVRYETTVIGDPNGAELPIAFVMPGDVLLFALYFNNNTSYLQIPDDGEHVASVYTVKANQMPEAFLPESVESVVVRSSTAGSTKLFKITVDDSGTITATEV